MSAVLGLDLSPNRNGYCVGDGLSTPTADVWWLPKTGSDLGAVVCAHEDWLNRLAADHDIGWVIYEAPLLLKHDKLWTIRRTYSLGGETERWCARRGIPCSEVDPKRLKKEITGDSYADKARVAFVVEHRLGIKLPDSINGGKHDAGDACGAWFIGLREHAPRIASAWDTKLWSNRGVLT